jgi:hypothetical protein
MRIVSRFLEQVGLWPETGFEEIGTWAALSNVAFPRSGLLARNNFRVARHSKVILNYDGRVWIGLW